MKKKRVIIVSIVILVLALAALVGVSQLRQHKPNQKEKKVISFVHGKGIDDYLSLDIIEGRDGSLEEFEKNATYYDIDGDGKKEILFTAVIGMMSAPGYVIYVFDPEMDEAPYIKAAYALANDDLEAWRSGKEYTMLYSGTPKLKVRFGTLYFQVYDSEDDKKRLNEYELLEQKNGNLIFDTHSDAGKCTATDYMEHIPKNE